jgi:ABC-type antimicrobial peptide transport system permease subunit
MLKHSLLLMYRNFRRHRSTFFINLIGLASGLACTLLIYLWVNDELHVDKYHQHEGRLYRLMEHRKVGNDIHTSESGLSAEALRGEMPQVEYAVTVTPPGFFPAFNLRLGNKNVRATGKFVDTEFFKVFSYGLVQGNEDQVLRDPDGVVLSEAMALRLFNTTQHVLGKTIEWQLTGGLIRTGPVTGIFRNVPANSTEQFDFVLTFESFKGIMNIDKGVSWNATSPFHAFVVLKAGSDPARFNESLARILRSKNKDAKDISLFLKPFSEKYLYGTYVSGQPAGGRIEYVRLFGLIAGFILVIACINFMNLSTAKASRRMKEVGIKKAVGAGRETLLLQYLGESMGAAFLSLLLALGLVWALLPPFNAVTGKALFLRPDAHVVGAFLGITFLTGLLAGSYPALYLSGFNPAVVLKGRFNASVGELWIRRGLVVFQFALSVIFIVSVLVVYRQIAFVQQKNLGYDKDNLIYFNAEGKVARNAAPFLDELRNLPGVVNAAGMFGYLISPYVATGGNDTGGSAEVAGPGGNGDEAKKVKYAEMGVDYHMIETLGFRFKAGRSFSRAFPLDSTRIIVNEAFVAAMGLRDPVGKIADGREILGVVENFHLQSLHEPVQPTVIAMNRFLPSTIVVNLRAGTTGATLERLNRFYKAYNPGFTFDYKFLDGDYQALYASERRVSVLSQYFAGLAVLISCLGLFGLAAFSAERRRKEIGVRKVFGAGEGRIFFLLSGDFTRLVGVAILVALPVSYGLARQWLSGFAYRIDLEAWYFIAAGLLALLIAFLTVGSQALRAARINPVECLKEE